MEYFQLLINNQSFASLFDVHLFFTVVLALIAYRLLAPIIDYFIIGIIGYTFSTAMSYTKKAIQQILTRGQQLK